MKKEFILPVMFLLTSCASLNREVKIPFIEFPNFLSQIKADYEILDPITKNACTESYNLYPFPFSWDNGDAEELAYQDLLYSANADAMIRPVIKKETKKIFIWYKKVCVTISGRPVRIRKLLTSEQTLLKNSEEEYKTQKKINPRRYNE